MKALLSPKGFDCFVLSISVSHGGGKEELTGERVLESAGGASLAVSRLAGLPGSVPVVNRQGMLRGNCLGVKPNTRHI